MQETIILKDLIKEPLQENLQTLFNHLGRYYYAIKKLNINKNDTILDIGCGQGYGSYLLSQYADEVYGLDLNRNFVKYAYDNFKKDNIHFLQYLELGEIPCHNKCICIETIEHLNKNEVERFIVKILIKLKNTGQLYLTFPIGKNKPSEYNPYHKCEPSIDFVYNIVKKYFKKIEIEIDNFENNYGHYQDYCILVAR